MSFSWTLGWGIAGISLLLLGRRSWAYVAWLLLMEVSWAWGCTSLGLVALGSGEVVYFFWAITALYLSAIELAVLVTILGVYSLATVQIQGWS